MPNFKWQWKTMINQSVQVNCNPNWPCRVLIIVGSWSGKTNVLLNLMKHRQQDAYKIYLCEIKPNISCLLTEDKKYRLNF